MNFIDSSAFAWCSSLADVVFERCTSLVEITIPPSVDIIEEKAFLSCSLFEIVNVFSPSIRVDKNAFYSCPLLKNSTPIKCKNNDLNNTNQKRCNIF